VPVKKKKQPRQHFESEKFRTAQSATPSSPINPLLHPLLKVSPL